MAATRREARRFVEAVVQGAFPDRPRVEPAGAREVLEFTLGVRRRRAPLKASDSSTLGFSRANRRRPGMD